MRIKTIELNNFLSHKKTNITLVKDIKEPPKIFIIDGINYDSDEDQNSSNGSGKSILASESVFYNIYGRSLRGTKKQVNLNGLIKNGCSRMSNSITYLVEDNETKEPSELLITRTKSEKGQSTVNIEIDGETKTKRTKRLSDKDIKLYIDMLPETFQQVVVYYKECINLLAMNYNQRLDFFKNLIDLTIIDDNYTKFKKFKDDNDRALEKLDMSKTNLEKIVNIVDENNDKYLDYLYGMLEDCVKKLDVANEKPVEDDTELKEEIGEKKNDLSELNKELDKYQKSTIIARNDADKVEKEIKRFGKLSGVECPTCKQMVTNDYVDKISKGYTAELENHLMIIEANKPKIDELNKKIKAIKSEIDELNKNINTIISNNRVREQNIRNIENEAKKIKKDIEKASTTKDKKVDKSNYEIQLNGVNRAIEKREQWAIGLNYWCEMFAPKSMMRSVIIRKYIDMLSDTFSYYISKLYNNEILSKISVDDDGQIDPIFYKENYEINYFQLSSGERKRVDIAMMLSLYEFVSYINPNMPKMIFLDEPMDSLDAPGIQSVVDVLLDIQKRHGLDLFLISHIPIPLENVPENIEVKHILVTKKDGNSSAKFIEDEK